MNAVILPVPSANPHSGIRMTHELQADRLMEKEKILIVDGESRIMRLVRHNLPEGDYFVKGVRGSEKAISEAIYNRPDLILIDLKASSRGGLNVCRELKSNPITDHIPIIIIAAKGRDSDVVAGRRLGADNCLTRPLSTRLLQAVMERILRNNGQHADEGDMVNIDGLVIDPFDHKVILHGAVLRLTGIEFAILHFLAQRPGQVLSRDQITRAVKGRDLHDTDRSLDVQMVQLRRKLGDAGQLIETVRGMGYRFTGMIRSKKKIAGSG